MKKIRRIAVDAGNKNIKVISDAQREPFYLLNTMMTAPVSRRTNFGFATAPSDSDLMKYLDVTVVSNGSNLGRKFVGEMAAEEGSRDRQLNHLKHNDNDILFAILTSAAVSVYDENRSKKTEQIALGTCLPTKEYYPEMIEEFHQRLVGTHVVTFHDPAFAEGSEITLKIDEDDLFIQAEGTTALLYLTTDDNGRPKPEFKDIIKDRMILVVDAGGSTTDLSAILGFKIVRDLFVSLDKGLLNAEETILSNLYADEPGFKITKRELDDRIRNHNSMLINGRRNWDVSPYVDTVIDEFTRELAEEVLNAINQLPPDKRRRVSTIVLTGGATAVVGKSLEAKLRETDEFDVVVSENAMYDNVLGAYRWVDTRMKQREKVTELPEASGE